jgi:hypothetical protein
MEKNHQVWPRNAGKIPSTAVPEEALGRRNLHASVDNSFLASITTPGKSEISCQDLWQ